jgi:multidrug efflux pump subunit AcrA (membrane-fusion protein)
VLQAEARLRAAAREQAYDEALAAREAADALLAVARADLDAAEIELDRTVVRALLEAMVLVVLVMLLFLGNLRATIIPMLLVLGLQHQHPDHAGHGARHRPSG